MLATWASTEIESQLDTFPANTLASALQLMTRCGSCFKSKNNNRNDETVLDAVFPDLLPNTQRAVRTPRVHSHLFPKQPRCKRTWHGAPDHSSTPTPPLVHTIQYINVEIHRYSVADQAELSTALILSWCVMQEQKDIGSGKIGRSVQMHDDGHRLSFYILV